MQNITSLSALKSHVLDAYAAGKDIDLDHCIYGPTTGSNAKGYLDETMSYYRLLAGHCFLTKSATVIEVGTHYGGSALAVLAGMRKGSAPNLELVTMDVTDLNRERLIQEPEIRKVIGDSTVRGFMESLADDLSRSQVDLLYIDALKDAGFVLKTLFNANAVGVKPTWLILDDVQTNDSMKDLWSLLEELEPEMSFLISRDYPEIRRPDMGYGIIYLPGTQDLMARCEEMMDILRLDTRDLWTATNEQQLEGAREIGKLGNYIRRSGDKENVGGFDVHISPCYDLAKDVYQGRGDIVEFGSFTGPTTRALAVGLRDNTSVKDKTARITTIDTFQYSMKSQESVINGRVAFGASTIQLVNKSVAEQRDMINVVSHPKNTVRWCGRPIEILVMAGLTTPQSSAHILTEFVPFMPVGESLILHREFVKPFRPWTSVAFAYLRENFEVMYYNDYATVLRFIKPISEESSLRILENRFSAEERVEMIVEQAVSTDFPNLKWDLLMQASNISVSAGEISLAEKMLPQLQAALTLVSSNPRKKAIESLAKKISLHS